MEEALIARLLASASLTALVVDRVHFSVSPQSAACPRVVVHVIDGAPSYHTEGASNLTQCRVQVDCWATTALSAVSVARAVKAALPESFTQDDVDFRVTQLAERTSFSGEGATARLHRVSVDFRVWHTA